MNDFNTNNTSPREGSGRHEAGQALAEYALILALVSIMAVGVTPVGQWVAVRLTDLAAAI